MSKSVIRSPLQSVLRSALGLGGQGGSVWSPAEIASCRILLDAYDPTALFQDTAGATPVTASGQTVGRWVSGTSHATAFTQSTSGDRPTFVASGVEKYLQFNGSNRWLSCAAFNWGTPRVTIVAALRKLSDSTIGVIAEFGNIGASNNGAFLLHAPAANNNNNWACATRGNTAVQVTASWFTAPISSQVTAILRNVSGDLLTQIRVNGTVGGTSTASQGTIVNYGNWPMYIGRRGGTTLPFNGQIYRLAMFTSNLTGDDLAKAEQWAASKI